MGALVGRVVSHTNGTGIHRLDEDEALAALAVLTAGWPGPVGLKGLIGGKDRRAIGGDLFDPADVAGILRCADGYCQAGYSPYLVLNPFQVGHQGALKDAYVQRRRWLFLDVDPVKADDHKHDPASDQEKDRAVQLAFDALDWLSALGWPAPTQVDSGNGYYLLYPIDLPADDASRDLVKAVVEAVAARFAGDDRGHIDKSVYNAARLAKLPGGLAIKGNQSDGRPYRRCRLVYNPDQIAPLTVEQLTSVANLSDPPRKVMVEMHKAESSLCGRVRGGADVEQRAIAYLERCPGAVSGAGGHPATFWAARALVRGFLLPEAAALRLLKDHFNPRCQPPWTDRELEHKVSEAVAKPFGKPDGWLLADDPPHRLNGSTASAGQPAADAARPQTWVIRQDGEDVESGEPDVILPDLSGILASNHDEHARVISLYTIGSILETTYPEPNWVVPGLMSEGLNILAGAPKQGKAQPLNAPVLTPTGYRPMGCLQVGDLVIGSNGKPTPVIAIHPQGDKPVFALRFSDGVTVEATGDHLWRIFDNTDRSRGRAGRVCSTADVAALLSAKKMRETYVPMCSPVSFDQPNPLPVHPYLLGVLLGDGSLIRIVSLSFGDDAILDCVAPTLPAGVTAKVGPARRYAYYVTPRGQANPLLDALRGIGVMGKRSYEKQIPPCYLLASPEDRLALLQGLLDTDGTVTINRCGSGQVVFATTSSDLAAQVAFLVQSLGGTARTRERQTYAYTRGTRKAGRPSQVIIIRLHPSLGCPFRLPSKSRKWHASRPGNYTRPVRRIVAVEPAGVKPCQCITVANADGLYLTDHCIVTHNSLLALNLALTVAGGGVALGDVRVKPADVLYLSLEDKFRRVKHRAVKMLRQMQPDLMDNVGRRLVVATEWPRQHERGLAAIAHWIRRAECPQLVIVDVWYRFAPPSQDRGNSYAQDAEHMGQLKRLADAHGVSFLVVHHTRKANPLKESDDYLQEVSGTMGITGAADGILVLVRQRADNRAVLNITGRDVGEQKYVLEFDKEALTWRSLGTEDEHIGGRVKQAVIRFLRGRGEEGAFLEDIATGTEEKKESVSVALSRMYRDGVLAKKGHRWVYPGPAEVEVI